MVLMIVSRKRRNMRLGSKEADMNLKKIIGAAAKEEVIGKVLKSGLPADQKPVVSKSRLAIGLGVLATVIGYLANYV